MKKKHNSTSNSTLSSSPSDNSSSDSSDTEVSKTRSLDSTKKQKQNKEKITNVIPTKITPKKPVVAIPVDPNMPVIQDSITIDPANLRRSSRSRKPPPRLINENKLQEKETNDNQIEEDNENQSSMANQIEKSSTEQPHTTPIDPASMELIRKLQAEDSSMTSSRKTRRSKLSSRKRKANTIIIEESSSSSNNSTLPSSSLSKLGPIPSPGKKRGRPSKKQNNTSDTSNPEKGLQVQFEGDLSHLNNVVPVLDTTSLSNGQLAFTFVPTPV